MAGIFGVISNENCIDDLFLGTFYLQHRAQQHCGLAICNEGKTQVSTHRGLLRTNFTSEVLGRLKGNIGIGSVSSDRQPVSELSESYALTMGYDGNIINYPHMKQILLEAGGAFSGYHDPDDVKDIALISKIIAKEKTFEEGTKIFSDLMFGDYAIIALSKEGIYFARGWGRKPLIIGKKESSWAISSESNSFVNTDFEIERDVKPGEIGILTRDGITTLKQLDLKPIKYGTFEWIYTAHPASVIDGRSVSNVRKKTGARLARRYPVEADIVSPIPNSGRWHAKGYAQESGIPYEEVFVRYDYSDRSYTQEEQEGRDLEARTKLIPVEESIRGRRIIIVDDSIVRGTQLLQRSKILRKYGAKEVHARIACPPLMHACGYGKSTKKDTDCIARRMPVEQIQKELMLDSLGYATAEDIGEAIGLPLEQLCLDCWFDKK